MAKVVTPSFVDDLTGKNLRNSDVAQVRINLLKSDGSAQEAVFTIDTHKDTVKSLLEKATKKSKPGRKSGSTKND